MKLSRPSLSARRASPLLLVALVVVAFSAALVPQVQATSNSAVLVQTSPVVSCNNGVVTSYACPVSFSNPVKIGDTIVSYVISLSAQCLTNVQTSDAYGSVYQDTGVMCVAYHTWTSEEIAVSTTPPTISGATVTVKGFWAAASSLSFKVILQEWSGLGPNPAVLVNSVSCTNPPMSCGTVGAQPTFATIGPTNFGAPAGYVVAALLTQQTADPVGAGHYLSGSTSVGAGYTQVPLTSAGGGGNYCPQAVAIQTINDMFCGEYSTSVGPSTSFPLTGLLQEAGAGQYPYALLGVVVTNGAASSATQTLGFCPSKNTATTSLTNSTVYYYEGTSVASSTLASVSTFVASITGSVSQTLYVGVYEGTQGQPVSATYPLNLVQGVGFSLSSGTKNSPINWVPSAVGTIPSGTIYAIAVLGNSKIALNQSATSGMYSVSSSSLPPTITSQSVNGAQLYLCSTASYALSTITTVTVTITTGAGSIVNPFGSNFATFVFALGSSFGFDSGTWGLIVTLVMVLVTALFLLTASVKLPGAFNPFVLTIAEFLVVSIATALTFFPFAYFLVVLFFAIGLGALKLGKVF